MACPLLLSGLTVTGILTLGLRHCNLAVGSRQRMLFSHGLSSPNTAQLNFFGCCHLHRGVDMKKIHRTSHRMGYECVLWQRHVSSGYHIGWHHAREFILFLSSSICSFPFVFLESLVALWVASAHLFTKTTCVQYSMCILFIL